MADSKISALTDGGAIAAGDQFAVNRGSVSKRVEPVGLPVLVYRYTVTGSDKTSIDTGVDTADAGSNDWTNGDLLEVYIYARTDETVTGSDIGITFNNDASGLYARTRMLEVGNGATFAGAGGVGATSILATLSGASQAANAFGTVHLTCPNYRGTVGYKEGSLHATNMENTTVGNVREHVNGWHYASTSALSRLAVAPATSGKKLKVGSQLLIYKRLSS